MPSRNVIFTGKSELAWLRRAIQQSDSSGNAEEGAFDRLYAYIDELAVKKEPAKSNRRSFDSGRRGDLRSG